MTSQATEAFPADLATALRNEKGAPAAWDALAPGHRREHLTAIEEAKRPETRARRIERAVAMLTAGLRRPVTPSTKTVAAKLLLKSGMALTVLAAPGDSDALLGPLPEGVTVSTRLAASSSAVLAFVKARKDAAPVLARIAKQAAGSKVIWVAYPKASALATDLNRDVLNALAAEVGLEGVAIVSVDATWSALRFRPR